MRTTRRTFLAAPVALLAPAATAIPKPPALAHSARPERVEIPLIVHDGAGIPVRFVRIERGQRFALYNSRGYEVYTVPDDSNCLVVEGGLVETLTFDEAFYMLPEIEFTLADTVTAIYCRQLFR